MSPSTHSSSLMQVTRIRLLPIMCIIRTIDPFDWSTVSVHITQLTPCFFVFLSAVYFGIFLHSIDWISQYNKVRCIFNTVFVLIGTLFLIDKTHTHTNTSTQFQTKYRISITESEKAVCDFRIFFFWRKKKPNEMHTFRSALKCN